MTTRNRRKFTPEFKAEAVEMVEAAGGNIAQVARELGIYDSTLGNWVQRAREQAAGAPSAEERAEIRELGDVNRVSTGLAPLCSLVLAPP
jgi:transposase-like protein